MASSNLIERLRQFSLLHDLEPEELDHIAGFAQEQVVPAGRELFRQGEPATAFYLVEEGSIEEVGIDTAGNQVLYRRAEAGDYIGRWAVLQDQTRRATATVRRTAKLLAIDADDFSTLLAMLPRLRERLERRNVVNRLLAIPLFAAFSPEEMSHVADLVHEVEYPAGQMIFQENEQADAFYVIDTGQVVEWGNRSGRGRGSWPKYLTAGSFFGRHSLLHKSPRRATARAETDVRLFRLNHDAFDWLRRFKPDFDKALQRPDVLGYLQRTGIFRSLNDDELRHLAGYVGLAHLRAEEVLYRQGEIDPTLYILYQGEAIIRIRDQDGKERPRGYLKAPQAAGEKSLFLQEPRDVTVMTTTGTNWFYLTRLDLDRFLTQYPDLHDKFEIREEVKVRRRFRRLPWMAPEEQLVLKRQRHWFFLARRVGPLLLALIVAVVFGVLPAGEPVMELANLFGRAFAVLLFLWVVWRFIDWLNDYYFVTTLRVAHQEKTLWIRETRDEAPLDKVQNVNLSQGFVGNALGFGRLVIETAAAVGISRVVFDHLARPDEVQQLIFEQVRRVKASLLTESRQFIRDRLGLRVGLGPQPTIPRPVIPGDEPLPAAPPPRPSLWQQLGNATWKQLLWIEHWNFESVTWRKHWLRLIAVVWLPALAVVGITALLVFYLAAPGDKVFLVLFLLAALWLSAAGWLSWNWTNWGNDLYTVTNDRIIDTERLPLGFKSKRTETTFDKVQNVSVNIPGPIATLLNFGTVTIFTAGAQGKLDFLWVRNPQRVQQEIFRRLRIYEERERARRRDEQWEMLPEWFAAYDEARRRT